MYFIRIVKKQVLIWSLLSKCRVIRIEIDILKLSNDDISRFRGITCRNQLREKVGSCMYSEPGGFL
jgi:hypothetical protein